MSTPANVFRLRLREVAQPPLDRDETPPSRRAVLDSLEAGMNYTDGLTAAEGLPEFPDGADVADELHGRAEALVRQVETHGRPFDHQVRAVLDACVRWLEREPE